MNRGEVVHEKVVGRRQGVPDQPEAAKARPVRTMVAAPRGWSQPGSGSGRRRPKDGDAGKERLVVAVKSSPPPPRRSRLRGVLRMASQVFWTCMRGKGRIERLEGRRVHGRGADRPGRQKGDVGAGPSRLSKAPGRSAETEHVMSGSAGCRAPRGWGEFFQTRKFAAPDGEPTDQRVQAGYLAAVGKRPEDAGRVQGSAATGGLWIQSRNSARSA